MYIQTLGNGPDLLLIHGWAMHGGIFHPLAERLADNHRVHVVDLPGHGRSRVDSAAFELTAIVERLTQALPPAVWIGWSLGGLLAIHA
ncbi:MAG: pimeloyl-[acyl-carrier protein] methyl ester esterase, partial [Lysobacterales bacterium CG_4_9_14_3_um_filter_62_6]